MTQQFRATVEAAGLVGKERDRLCALNVRLLSALNLALTQLIDNDTADTDDLISVGNAIREAIAAAQPPDPEYQPIAGEPTT